MLRRLIALMAVDWTTVVFGELKFEIKLQSFMNLKTLMGVSHAPFLVVTPSRFDDVEEKHMCPGTGHSISFTQ